MTPTVSFTIDQAALSTALTISSRSAAPRTTIIALSHVLLRADSKKQELEFSATDLRLTTTVRASATVLGDGGVTIPAKLLADWVSRLPAGQVQGEIDEEKCTLALKIGRYRSSFNGLSAKEFPSTAQEAATGEFDLERATLDRVVSGVAIAASEEQAQVVWTGVCLRQDGDSLMWCATNTQRMAALHTPGAGLGEAAPVIPSSSLVELAKTAREIGGDKPLHLTLRGGSVTAETTGPEDGTLKGATTTMQLIAFKFPNILGFVPKSHVTEVRADREQLAKIVAMANLFARDDNSRIRLEIQPGEIADSLGLLMIRGLSVSGGTEVELDAEIDGQPLSLMLSAKYLSEAVQSVGTGKAVLRFLAANKPVLVLPDSEERYFHVVTPIVGKAKEEASA